MLFSPAISANIMLFISLVYDNVYSPITIVAVGNLVHGTQVEKFRDAVQTYSLRIADVRFISDSDA